MLSLRALSGEEKLKRTNRSIFYLHLLPGVTVVSVVAPFSLGVSSREMSTMRTPMFPPPFALPSQGVTQCLLTEFESKSLVFQDRNCCIYLRIFSHSSSSTPSCPSLRVLWALRVRMLYCILCCTFMFGILGYVAFVS